MNALNNSTQYLDESTLGDFPKKSLSFISEKELSDYSKRLAPAAHSAEDQEIKTLSCIKSYEFALKNIKIKASVDYIKIAFHAIGTNARGIHLRLQNKLKGRKGLWIDTRGDSKYIITIQDPISKANIYKILMHLKYYDGFNLNNCKIECIELSIDFFNAHQALVIALYKSLNFKVHRFANLYRQAGECEKIPPSPLGYVYNKITSSYNIGVGDKRIDPIYYHLYYKTVNNIGESTETLHIDQHSVRVEVRLQNEGLKSNKFSDLKKIINSGFREHLAVTTFRSDRSTVMNYIHKNTVMPFGKDKQQTTWTNSRNKTTISKSIIKHSELNKIISKQVNSLLRNY